MNQKTAVITGAASGIGRALAQAAATRGYSLALSDVDEAGLKTLASKLEKKGTTVFCQYLDVSDGPSVHAFADQVFDNFAQVDLLFNNAGVMAPGRLWEQDPADFELVMCVNFWGVYNAIRSFVPRMLESGLPGRIINTSSVAGLIASPRLGAYSTSKHAVICLSETLHYELAEEGSLLEVSVLCPGPVATEIMNSERSHPSEKLQETDDTKAFHKILKMGTVQVGMSPVELARVTFEGIEKGNFWILPHPDQLPPVRTRADGILTGKNPAFIRWEGVESA